jgi:CubicO group peptidase (beta-lactamase class C family)
VPVTPATSVLAAVDGWDVPHVAVAVVGPDGALLDSRGDLGRPFRLASISKVLTAHALMIAVHNGTIGLDDEAGPPGSTLAHLLAHASGYGFEAGDPIFARAGERRIYSNAGIEAAAAHLERRIGVDFDAYLNEALFLPLGMDGASLYGSPAHGVHGTVEDLLAFAGELFTPRLLPPEVIAEATRVQFPGLNGVIPGLGRFDPCDWGFGFERNFAKTSTSGQVHWAGQRVSAQAVGHFGGAGTFFWLDPVARLACACLTDRPFDTWALAAWPPLCDAVVDRFAAG